MKVFLSLYYCDFYTLKLEYHIRPISKTEIWTYWNVCFYTCLKVVILKSYFLSDKWDSPGRFLIYWMWLCSWDSLLDTSNLVFLRSGASLFEVLADWMNGWLERNLTNSSVHVCEALLIWSNYKITFPVGGHHGGGKNNAVKDPYLQSSHSAPVISVRMKSGPFLPDLPIRSVKWF